MVADEFAPDKAQGAASRKDASTLSLDAVLGGLVRLHQRRKGHRAGTDGVLLAACLPPEAREIADLGAGNGVVGLIAARLNPLSRVVLFERDAEALALAERNIAENALEARVRIAKADALALGKAAEWREKFDFVLSNPPFHPADAMRPSPDAGKAAAHAMPKAALPLWLAGMAAILAPKGRFVLIHRADALLPILSACERRFGGLTLKFVQPAAEKPAIRVLVSGQKGSRAPLRIVPPLILHAEDGAFLPQAAALQGGQARLDLFS